METETIAGALNIVFTIAVFVIYFYYIAAHKSLDELSRRFLLSGFFFVIHELTFFLGDAFVYELTKVLFFISLFYSLLFVVTQNQDLKKELAEQKARNERLKETTEEIAESWLAEKHTKQ